MPLTIGTWNPSSANKESGFLYLNPQRGIQNPRLSLITLHDASLYLLLVLRGECL